MIFHFVNTDIRFPTMTGWYLEVTLNNLLDAHKAVSAMLWNTLGKDPHLVDQETKKPRQDERIGSQWLISFYYPAELSARWLETAEKFMAMSEGHLLVNFRGGFLLPANTRILHTIESDTLLWPGQIKDERIVIRRWPQGKHYHLVSDKNRVFMPSKYDTLVEAMTIAKALVPEDHIEFKNEKVLPEGD